MSFKQFHLISLFKELTAKQAVVVGYLRVLGDRSTCTASHNTQWHGGQPGDPSSTRLKIITSLHGTRVGCGESYHLAMPVRQQLHPTHSLLSRPCDVSSSTSTPSFCLFFHPRFNLSIPNQDSCTSYKLTIHLFLNTSSLVKLMSNDPAERQQTFQACTATSPQKVNKYLSGLYLVLPFLHFAIRFLSIFMTPLRFTQFFKPDSYGSPRNMVSAASKY